MPFFLPSDRSGTTSGLKWLFLDLNSYFASVEQQENPALRGRPVAVLPAQTDTTCAIAASYEAKAYGIKTGTKIYEAKKMCPDLICVPAKHQLYVAYHHRIMESIARHIPIHKNWSIDELSSRLLPARRNETAAQDIAIRIKEQICIDIGPAITCSIGIAPNIFLAKIASDMQKPDGLVLLREQDLPGPLFDLRLSDLPGIGYNMEARLARCGIRTIEQLWHLPPKQARAVWGSVQGERFWYQLRGHDLPYMGADRDGTSTTIGHSRVLAPTHYATTEAKKTLQSLCMKACQRLRRAKLYAGDISISIRLARPVTPPSALREPAYKWKGEMKTHYACDDLTFLNCLNQLWDEMLTALNPQNNHEISIKKVSINLLRLRKEQDISGNLFGENTTTKARESLSNAIQILNTKYRPEYGGNIVSYGPPPNTQHQENMNSDAKIAFSRIPNTEEFNQPPELTKLDQNK